MVDVVAHDSYLINLGSPDDALWERSIGALVDEIERCAALGIGDLVCHPGAHMGAGEQAGLDRIAAGLGRVLERTPAAAVRIDLEATAGQGSTLGHRLEHLGTLLQCLDRPDRLGVCLDTCHLFAAGYSFEAGEPYNAFKALLVQTIGLDAIRVWHLNDSVKPRGSRVDRHAGVGRGAMGLDAFRGIVADPDYASRPMILETPKGMEEGRDLDAVNLEVLRRLWDQSLQAATPASPRVPRTRRRPS
jgi:deoxyribonuclease-4